MVAPSGMANTRQAPTLPESSSSGRLARSARTIVSPQVGSWSRIAHDSEEGPRSPRTPGCGIQVVQRSQTSGGTTSFKNGQKITSGSVRLANRRMSSADIGVGKPRSSGRMTSCPSSRSAAHTVCGEVEGEDAGQDHQVVLARGDVDRVGVAKGEPALGDGRHRLTATADGELVVEQVAGHLQVAGAGRWPATCSPTSSPS